MAACTVTSNTHHCVSACLPKCAGLDVPETAAILEEALEQAEAARDASEATTRVLTALLRLRQRGSFRRVTRGVR